MMTLERGFLLMKFLSTDSFKNEQTHSNYKSIPASIARENFSLRLAITFSTQPCAFHLIFVINFPET
jgi:hypothetical protein